MAESISQQAFGDATAWLISGNVIVIDVAGSFLYQTTQSELEAQATKFAEQALDFTEAPLESIVITFHEHEVTDNQEKMRQLIFLVIENQPVLHLHLNFHDTGPLTPDEIDATVNRLGESLARDQKECVRKELKKRAHDAGDPETLDAASLEFLTADTWNELDAFGKRLILTGALTTEALITCAQHKSD